MGEVRVLDPEPGPRVDEDTVSITYAVDKEQHVIYWRCEREACPSRITEDGKEGGPPFVGTISYEEISYGMALLGSVAVAHAVHLDGRPLEHMSLGHVQEGDQVGAS